MRIDTLYAQIGGNYEEAIRRMRKDERIVKYLTMLLQDEAFAQLQDAMAKDDMHAAFLAAHTLKGISGNLVLTRLHSVIVPFVEDLRNDRDIPHAKATFPEVASCYESIIQAIRTALEA